MLKDRDFTDTEKVGEIIRKIDKVDGKYFASESDVMYKHQPFLISLMLGYRQDFKPKEIDDVIMLIFIIWEYFKNDPKVKIKQVTDNQFERIQKRNIHLLKYIEGADSLQEESDVVASDLRHLRSKALLTGIIFRLNNQDALRKMNQKSRGVLTVEMKCLIECFEEITKE